MGIFITVMFFLAAIVLRCCTGLFLILIFRGSDWAIFYFFFDLVCVFWGICNIFVSPFTYVDMMQEEDVNAESEEMYVFEDDDLYELYMAPKPWYQEQDDYCKDTDPLDYGY